MNRPEEIIIKGLPASGGIAVGPAYVFERQKVFVRERMLSSDEVDLELQLLDEAITKSSHELEKISAFAKSKIDDDAAMIFDSQILMLTDEVLLSSLKKRIRDERKNADFLMHDELESYKVLLSRSSDELLRERIDDIDEVGQRVLRNLQKNRLHSTVEGEHIIIAKALTPSDTILFSKNDVLAYATDLGGITSHAAILARSLKIPAVTGLHTSTQSVSTGDLVIIDGQRGLMIINPTAAHQQEYKEKIARIERFEKELEGVVDLPCVTPDGHRVELSANAEFINELEYVITQGSKGIGLYRTEHLYISKGDFPSEQDQFVDYSEIAHMMYPQPVIFRTFDIGGDKLLDLNLTESNPSLGWRGIRMMLDKPVVFRNQLRALLRASTMKNIKIMFPMISGTVEVREALDHLNEVKQELRSAGINFDENMELGVMIEVPSAVFVADELAEEVDFFSIGTNDLIQYLMAVDRDNDLIADLFQEFHPAVLRAVKQIIDTGHRHGIWVGRCGEMAGNPVATTLLLGFGLDEFSMVPSVIPEVKKIIHTTRYDEALQVAEKALSLSTSVEIREYLTEHLRGKYPELFVSLLNGDIE